MKMLNIHAEIHWNDLYKNEWTHSIYIVPPNLKAEMKIYNNYISYVTTYTIFIY